MTSLWLVARHEYQTMVGKRSFLLATLAFPLLIAAVMAIAIFFSTGRQDRRPVGYVDQAGLLGAVAAGSVSPTQNGVQIRAYESLEDARRALEAQEIQAVYVLPSDYARTRRVTLLYWDDPPGEAARGQFRRFVRASVAASLPGELRKRAIEGPELVIRSADGRRQMAEEDWLSFVLPIVAGVLFMVAIMTSSGYLLRAVTTEKENRTMELMITSMTPEQLLGGKALGLMAVSLTQLGVWVVTGVIALLAATQVGNAVRLGQMPWSTVGVILVFFLPSFALVGGAMAAIGSAVTEYRQGQQIASIVNLVFMAPFFLIALILAEPNSPLMVVLTLFPTTAFLTIVLRWSVTLVPLWQMVASWLLLVAAAVASVWAAARILRVGMLRYGQRLDVRVALAALRGKP